MFQHFKNQFNLVADERPGLGDLEIKMIGGQDGAFLIQPFLLEEIKEAVWDCDSFKSL